MKIMAVMTNYANAKNHVRAIYQSLPQTQVMKKGCETIFSGGGERGGGPPLYKPYRYVLPQRVGFLRRFCLKTGIDFAGFGLESGQPRHQGASVPGLQSPEKAPWGQG